MKHRFRLETTICLILSLSGMINWAASLPPSTWLKKDDLSADMDQAVKEQKIPVTFSRIIGGQPAPKHRYPFAHVSLSLNGGHQCGGSVIAPDVILTAAHCKQWFDAVNVGQYSLNQDSNQQSLQTFRPLKTLIHPKFVEATFQNDFALIILNGTISNVPYIRLNHDYSLPTLGQNLLVVGWGATNISHIDNPQYPSTLQVGRVSYMTNDQCRQAKVQGDQLYQGEIFDSMMCAANPGVDACVGDSGGPLFSEGSNSSASAGGDDVLVGMVSWGRGCAVYPGVYSRISAGYAWIRQKVCWMSVESPDYMSCKLYERNPRYRKYTIQTKVPSMSPTSTRLFSSRIESSFPSAAPTRQAGLLRAVTINSPLPSSSAAYRYEMMYSLSTTAWFAIMAFRAF